jgi:hypothetical protein
MRLKELDVISVLVFPILAATVTVLVRTDLLVSVLMFFGLPATYITLRNPGIFKKSLAFAFLVSIPLSLFVDTLAAINGSWIVPNSVFHFKIFGVATIEVYLFGLLWVLYTILFYEHFFAGGQRGDRMSSHIIYFICLSITLIAYVVVGFLFNNDLLYIPYFYAIVGIILVVIPLILFLAFYPFFWRRFLLVGVYFFFLLFLFEIAALATGQWMFPGIDFVDLVQIFGFRIPIEEVIIWMLFATVSLLSYYEIFGDDRLL